MPTAPVAGPQVQPGQMPGPMLNPSAATPEAFGAGIGRAVQNVGGALQQIYREEQEKADNLALTDAVSKAYQADTKHRYSDGQDGGMVGISVMQGDDLFANASKVAQSFQNELNGISETLTPNQRLRFTQATQSIRGSFESSMAIRIAQERQKKAEDVSKNAVFSIGNSFEQRAAIDPDSLTPIGLREAIEATKGAVRIKYDNAPAKPTQDAITLEENKTAQEFADNILKGLIGAKRFSQAQAMVDDESLAETFSGAVRSWAIGRVKEHKEQDGSRGIGQGIWEDAVALVNGSKDGIIPEVASVTARREALKRLEAALPGEQNAQARAKAKAQIEANADNDFQIRRLEQSAIMDALTKEIINGSATYGSVRNNFRFSQLGADQQARLAEISNALNTPPTEERNTRLANLKAQWESNAIPSNVKEVIAQWQHIQAASVPNVKELFESKRQNSADWIIAQWLSPKLKELNSASTDKDFKDRQEEVTFFWPKTAKEIEVVVNAQQALQKELQKQDPLQESYAKTANSVAKDKAELMHPKDTKKQKEAAVKLYDQLLRSRDTVFAENIRKQTAVPEMELKQLASKIAVDEAAKSRWFVDKKLSFDEINKLPKAEQEEFIKDAFIPMEKIDANFLAEVLDRLDALKVQNATQKQIEKMAFDLWMNAKQKTRPATRFSK